MKSNLIDIACEVRAETEKAFLIHDGIRTAWLPKTQCQDNEDGTFTIPEWLAQEKELI